MEIPPLGFDETDKPKIINKSKSHDNITLLQLTTQCQPKKHIANVGLKLTKSLSDFSKFLNSKASDQKHLLDKENMMHLSIVKEPEKEQIYASIKKKDKRASLSLGNLKNVEPLYASTPLKSLENIEIVRVENHGNYKKQNITLF